ncbi:MAG: TIGR02281 family clan AA aspartic protease [Sulfuricellaceae bacterium]|nr:TIGR02281 family clan AA aspartic protease [Sulfuricellaceae bacterium]
MSRPFPSGHITALIIWVVVFAAIYLYFDARQNPGVAIAIESTRGEVQIPRSRDGHYYVKGAINGHSVTFMVDTGASTVSIDQDTAQAANLPHGAPSRFETAGGAIIGEIVADQAVVAGGIAVEGLSIAVGTHGKIALLGQNFLRKVEMLQSSDTMTLRVKVIN